MYVEFILFVSKRKVFSYQEIKKNKKFPQLTINNFFKKIWNYEICYFLYSFLGSHASHFEHYERYYFSLYLIIYLWVRKTLIIPSKKCFCWTIKRQKPFKLIINSLAKFHQQLFFVVAWNCRSGSTSSSV